MLVTDKGCVFAKLQKSHHILWTWIAHSSRTCHHYVTQSISRQAAYNTRVAAVDHLCAHALPLSKQAAGV